MRTPFFPSLFFLLILITACGDKQENGNSESVKIDLNASKLAEIDSIAQSGLANLERYIKRQLKKTEYNPIKISIECENYIGFILYETQTEGKDLETLQEYIGHLEYEINAIKDLELKENPEPFLRNLEKLLLKRNKLFGL